IHQFDKLRGRGGQCLFHPNGNEVLVDEAVWDLRTRRLVRTLGPEHEGGITIPSPGGGVLYSY
ncbi:unnamed protein product, partial [Discosporangium mesarthrocarpum]